MAHARVERALRSVRLENRGLSEYGGSPPLNTAKVCVPALQYYHKLFMADWDRCPHSTWSSTWSLSSLRPLVDIDDQWLRRDSSTSSSQLGGHEGTFQREEAPSALRALYGWSVELRAAALASGGQMATGSSEYGFHSRQFTLRKMDESPMVRWCFGHREVERLKAGVSKLSEELALRTASPLDDNSISKRPGR